MAKLFIFNFILIAVIAFGIFFVKRIKSERRQNLLFICAALVTVLFHYSTFLYRCFDGTAVQYLRENANLLLPIYPCNVLMWSAVIFAFCKNKRSKVGSFLADYLFWFGIISTLVGMFANVDFIMNPTFADYDIVKSIVAHATLLFNILLLPIFGYIKVDIRRNMLNILISIFVMYVIGLYCNLVFQVLASAEAAYDVNSMFILHSPFDGLDFLTYPVIALIAIPIYFGLFCVCELFVYEKGARFYNRIYNRCKEKQSGKR